MYAPRFMHEWFKYNVNTLITKEEINEALDRYNESLCDQHILLYAFGIDTYDCFPDYHKVRYSIAIRRVLSFIKTQVKLDLQFRHYDGYDCCYWMLLEKDKCDSTLHTQFFNIEFRLQDSVDITSCDCHSCVHQDFDLNFIIPNSIYKILGVKMILPYFEIGKNSEEELGIIMSYLIQ